MFGQNLTHHIPGYGIAFICKNHIQFNDNQASSYFTRKNYVQVVEKLSSLTFFLILSYF